MDTKFKKGMTPWNKGKEHIAVKGNKNPAKRNNIRLKISKALKGKNKSLEHIEKLKLVNKGKTISEETRQKMRASAVKGKNSNFWKGGISKFPYYGAFMSREYQIRKKGNGGSHTISEWETLKAQYNWTCPCCKRQEPEIKLNQDHIIPLSKGGSNNIENIQPLCKSCNSKKSTQIITYLKPT